MEAARWLRLDAGTPGLEDEVEEEEDIVEHVPGVADEDGRVRPLTRWGGLLAPISSTPSTTLRFLLYGGRDGCFSEGYTYPQEVWTCALTTAEGEQHITTHTDFNWRYLPPSSATDVPPGRFLHALCSVGENKVLVWGGHDDDDVFDDLYVLDVADGAQCKWTRLLCEGVGPGPRFAAGFVPVSPSSVLAYGGKNDQRAFNDLYYLRVSVDDQKAKWEAVSPTAGDPPMPRDCGTVNLVKNKMYVIGGTEEEKEVFVFDIDAGTWTALGPKQEDELWPTLRSGHACSVVDDRFIVMFGGCTPESLHGDTYVFDTETSTWTELRFPEGRTPMPRAGHALVTLNDGRSIALFGGESARPGEDIDMLTHNDLCILVLPSNLSTSVN